MKEKQLITGELTVFVTDKNESHTFNYKDDIDDIINLTFDAKLNIVIDDLDAYDKVDLNKLSRDMINYLLKRLNHYHLGNKYKK